jgi:hypothetical protein
MKGTMPLTDQYSVLTLLRKAHGASSFTEHHINYKRVGTKYRGVWVTAMGDTWDEVVDKLNAKIASMVETADTADLSSAA